MAVNLDNLDDVIKQMAKMEKAVELEVIREVRKKFRATMRKLVPTAKKASPIKTGQLRKSIKVKSRSKRGLTKVQVKWLVAYAGPLNFKKGQAAEKYATDLWQKEKSGLDKKGFQIVRETMKQVMEKYGVKVK
jgi:hypothetical protein